MAKFIFEEAICGGNRSYTVTYYTWLCHELIKAHKDFLWDYHQWHGGFPRTVTQVNMTLESLRQDTYQDFTRKSEGNLFESLAALRELFNSSEFIEHYRGKPRSRIKFQAHVEDIIERIKRESEKISWLSMIVQRHFYTFAVRPMTQFTMTAISYSDANHHSPVRESMFHSLAELRDRAYRDPTVERVERYLKKVELIRGTAPYKRLRYIANHTTDGAHSKELQELEDELSVAVLWEEHTRLSDDTPPAVGGAR